jgi:hypothetical protein
MQDIITKIKNWVISPKETSVLLPESYCQTRDVFQSRLNYLLAETQNPLLTAINGEIGNNS